MRRAVVGLALLTFILSYQEARAQTGDGASGSVPQISALPTLDQANPLQQLRQRMGGGGGSSLTLEGAVDPDTYIIGPGDGFSISIGGAIPLQMTEQVGADGILSLPDVGAVEVAGRPLSSVEKQLQDLLRQYNRNVSIAVSLAQPRQFFVHLSGAVPRPGRYLAIPAARVSDVLEDSYSSLQGLYSPTVVQSGADQPGGLLSATSERPRLSEGYRPSFRSITLIRRDGTEQSIDLYRYFATGDTEQNPYLLDGDVLSVAPYHVEREAVRVVGAVAYPGMFPYRRGDMAADVLQLASSGEEFSAMREVRLTRRGENGEAVSMMLDLAAIRAGQASDTALQPGDKLTVVEEAGAVAYIQGWVEYPGLYPVKAGETTLRELVELAGGLRSDVNLEAAFMVRGESNMFKANARATDLDFFSRAFLASSLRENRMVIDIAGSLQPGADDVVIYNGDRVVFPPDEGTVYVTGNVPRPGYVPYMPGQNAEYYIELAGGLAPDSRGVYVFEQNTGETRTGIKVPVVSGTTIFVDRRPVAESPEMAQIMLSDEASKRQSRIMTTQTIITGISAITSIITAYVAITR